MPGIPGIIYFAPDVIPVLPEALTVLGLVVVAGSVRELVKPTVLAV
jgi:hypothetical protein